MLGFPVCLMMVASVNVCVSSLEAKWAKGLEQKKDRALNYSLVMRLQAQILNCETGGLSLRVSSGSCQPPHPASYDYPNIPAPLLRKALSFLALVQSQGIHYEYHRFPSPNVAQITQEAQGIFLVLT